MKKCGRFVFVCMCVCATRATKLPKYYTQYLYTQYISILFPAQNGNMENGKAFVTPRHDKQTIAGFLFNNFQQQNSNSQVRTGSRPVLDELYFWQRGMIQMESQYICLCCLRFFHDMPSYGFRFCWPWVLWCLLFYSSWCLWHVAVFSVGNFCDLWIRVGMFG